MSPNMQFLFKNHNFEIPNFYENVKIEFLSPEFWPLELK